MPNQTHRAPPRYKIPGFFRSLLGLVNTVTGEVRIKGNVKRHISPLGSPRRRRGHHRVARLRKQAAESGLNPDVWFENVELIAAQDIGQETITYVLSLPRVAH